MIVPTTIAFPACPMANSPDSRPTNTNKRVEQSGSVGNSPASAPNRPIGFVPLEVARQRTADGGRDGDERKHDGSHSAENGERAKRADGLACPGSTVSAVSHDDVSDREQNQPAAGQEQPRTHPRDDSVSDRYRLGIGEFGRADGDRDRSVFDALREESSVDRKREHAPIDDQKQPAQRNDDSEEPVDELREWTTGSLGVRPRLHARLVYSP